MNTTYQDYLNQKKIVDLPTGIEVSELNPMLFDFQRDIVRWALRRGRACIFADCGLGKTPMQLEWAKQIHTATGGNILILAPLAVSQQTIREGQKFGIEVNYCRNQQQVKPGITITNYEMLEHFEPDKFVGVVLDESSILKSFTGKIRTEIIEKFEQTAFKLACTATPSPNDLMELGNHAEFVGAMSRTEMLSMFFVHDGGETQKWRLKGHAKDDFWKWVCIWSVMIRKPSDLGYQDNGFILPPLNIHEVVVDVDNANAVGTLFVMEANTLQERQSARRSTTNDRCRKAAEIVNGNGESWLIWCDRNDESATLKKMIEGAVEVKGSDTNNHKETSLLGFAAGEIKRLVSKPSIAGFGMNFQVCHNVIFVGLSDSYEQFYQAIRRTWRFGQTKPVQCHIITSEIEGAVVANIKRKEKQAMELADGMVQNMHVYNESNIKGIQRNITNYLPQESMIIPQWLRSIA